MLNLLPKGTHEYARFIKPSELAPVPRSRARAPATPRMTYNPCTRRYGLGSDTDVNYLIACSARHEPPGRPKGEFQSAQREVLR